MQARQYKPIIVHALNELKERAPFPNTTALGEYIVTRMIEYEVMSALFATVDGPEVGVIVPVMDHAELKYAPPAAPLALAAMAPSPSVALPLRDISERIPENASNEPAHHFTVDQLYDWYSEHLPETIEIQPPGFTAPIHLRRSMSRSPEWGSSKGDGGFVRIYYAQPGSNVDGAGAQTTVHSTDAKMDVRVVLDDIEGQAKGLFRSAPVNIQTRLPRATPGSIRIEAREATAQEKADWDRATSTPRIV